jgi:hypothetical protein
MKATNTNTATTGQELDVMSKLDLLLVKTTIILFGVVLNICCINLLFY